MDLLKISIQELDNNYVFLKTPTKFGRIFDFVSAGMQFVGIFLSSSYQWTLKITLNVAKIIGAFKIQLYLDNRTSVIEVN